MALLSQKSCLSFWLNVIKIFVLLVFVICTSNIFADNSKLNPSVFSISDPSFKAIPGQGVESGSNSFRYPCIVQDPLIPLAYAGALSSQGKFYYDYSKSILDSESKVGGTGSVDIGIASVSAEVSLSQLLSSDDETLSMVYEFDLNGQTAVANNLVLSVLGKSLFNTPILDPTQIREKCGDGFISSVDLGAKIYVVLKAHFSNAEAKKDFMEKYEVSVLWGTVTKTISSSFDHVKNTAFITVNAYQFGGNPAELNLILLNNKAKYGCTLDNLAPCTENMKQLMAYATGKNEDGSIYPNSFVTQLNNMKYSPMPEVGPGIVNFHISSYERMGFPQLDPNSYPTDPTIVDKISKNTNVLIAKANLKGFYDAQISKLARIQLLENSPNACMTPSLEEKKLFDSYANAIKINTDNIQKALQTCNTYPNLCASTEENIVNGMQKCGDEDCSIVQIFVDTSKKSECSVSKN